VIELENFVERFRRLNKFELACGGAVGPFPKPDDFRSEPVSQLFLIQRRQLPKRMNPPFVQDSEDFLC